jgi:hypothetical protein
MRPTAARCVLVAVEPGMAEEALAAGRTGCVATDVYLHNGEWVLVAEDWDDLEGGLEGTTEPEGGAVGSPWSFHGSARNTSAAVLRAVAARMAAPLVDQGRVFQGRAPLAVWPMRKAVAAVAAAAAAAKSFQPRASPARQGNPFSNVVVDLDAPVVLLLKQADFGDGHGHSLHDVALAAYWAMRELLPRGRGQPRHNQVVFLGERGSPYDEWLETVSDRPPASGPCPERQLLCLTRVPNICPLASLSRVPNICPPL